MNEELLEDRIVIFYRPCHLTAEGATQWLNSRRIFCAQDRVCIKVVDLKSVITNPGPMRGQVQVRAYNARSRKCPQDCHLPHLVAMGGLPARGAEGLLFHEEAICP